MGCSSWKRKKKGGKGIYKLRASNAFNMIIVLVEQLARGDPLPSSVKPSDPMPELLQLVESGKLKPVVPRSYSLKDFMQAFDSLAKRRAIGKVIVSSGAEPVPSARL